MFHSAGYLNKFKSIESAIALVAIRVVTLLVVPIARLLPYAIKIRFFQPLLDFLNGVVALSLAVTLFLLLSVPISILLPLIVAAWLTFYFLAYGQSKVAWLAAIAGLISCWIVYRVTFATSA